jgi:hypothetical protein
MSIDAFKAWMQESTMDEKETVVAAADTSLPLLYQLASGHRKASADLASRVARGITLVGKKKRKTPLPVVLRGDLCETCSKCEYYKGDCK